MRLHLPAVLPAGALVLSLLGPAGTAAADPRELPSPSAPEATATAAPEAADVLDEAQALFEDRSRAEARVLLADGGLDATMVLNQLIRVRDDLGPQERRQADAILARPTDNTGGPYGDEYTVDEETPVCGDTVCIHYVKTTQDAPDMTDGDDENTTPDSVDQALDTAEAVNDLYVAAGYRRPDGDGDLGGRSDFVDVYLSDLGNQQIYGYCTTDQTNAPRGTWNRWAYCSIDDDFAEFPGHTPLENQQVTLAHEYFHAVQYAYDAFEDPWIVEATATWAEDEAFDGVDDNRQYLPVGQMQRPAVPLDANIDLNVYGNWIFFRYLTERWPAEKNSMPTLVRDVWRKLSGAAGDPDMFSTQAIQSVLAARGAGFTSVYGQFADANRRPQATYEEGGAYPKAPLARAPWTLSSYSRSTGEVVRRLDHLTSRTFSFQPGGDLAQADWRLRLTFDMPAKKTAPVARISRYLDNGTVQPSTVRLKRDGTGTKTVGFSGGNVDHVELVIANASRRSNCWTRDLTFACQGDPRDDKMRTVFGARVFRS
jgi:hypothetical protein